MGVAVVGLSSSRHRGGGATLKASACGGLAFKSRDGVGGSRPARRYTSARSGGATDGRGGGGTDGPFLAVAGGGTDGARFAGGGTDGPFFAGGSGEAFLRVAGFSSGDGGFDAELPFSGEGCFLKMLLKSDTTGLGGERGWSAPFGEGMDECARRPRSSERRASSSRTRAEARRHAASASLAP